MRVCRTSLVAALAAAVFPLALAGQATSTVQGTVKSGPFPVQGATVHLDNTSIGFHRKIGTDATGQFRFEGVSPAGGYWITVNDQGDRRLRALEARFDIGLSPPLHLTLPAIDLARHVTVTGRVSGEAGMGAGLRVALVNKDRAGRDIYPPQSTQTNASGVYSFAGVRPDAGYSINLRDTAGARPISRRVVFGAAASAAVPVQVADVLLGGGEKPKVAPPLLAGVRSAPPVQQSTGTVPETTTTPAPSSTTNAPATTAPVQTAETGSVPPEISPSQSAPASTPPVVPSQPGEAGTEAANTPGEGTGGASTELPSEPATTASMGSSGTAVSAGQAVAQAPSAPAGGPTVQNDFEPEMVAAISRQQLELLPLFNRNFLTLGGLIPGVHDVTAGSPLQGAGFSISGSRPISTDFLLDGQDNVASNNNQAIPFQVNDAIQEFRVVYSNPGAEYGQSAGGVVDVVTNRGSSETKAWHGSLFGYFNNDALNSNTPLSVYTGSTYFDAAAYAGPLGDTSATDQGPIRAYNAAGQGLAYSSYAPIRYNALYSLLGDPGINGLYTGASATPLYTAGQFDTSAVWGANDSHVQPFSSQQFGGRIGGPAGKRLFVFGSFEGTRIDNPNPIFERVPSSNDLCASTIPAVTGPSPLCAAGNADALAAQKVLALYPRGNVTGPTGTFAFYRGVAPNYTHVQNVLFRPDLSLGSKGSLSLRYTGQLLDQLHDDSLPATTGGYPGNGAERRAQNQSLALVHTATFAGSRINVARLGFTQFRLDELAQDRKFDFTGAGVVPATYVLSGIDTQLTGAVRGLPGAMGGWYDSFWNPRAADPTYSPSPITPSLDGDFPFARIGAPLSAPSAHRDTEGEGSDTFQFNLGKHSFSVGADYRYQQNIAYEGGLQRGVVVSNNIGEFTSDSETCISCNQAFNKPSFDYELRQPAGYVGDLRSSAIAGFAEDRFNVSQRLTLTAGVRYEYFGQPLDAGNRLWNYDVAAGGLVKQAAAGTFDPFGYPCLSSKGNASGNLDSIYGAKSISFQDWNCQPGGRFSLPQNSKDIAPRLGFAFSPDPDYHTVVRAAVGLYYDHLPASYNEQLLMDRPSPLDAAHPSAVYGQNFFSAACGGYQCGLGNTTLNGGGAFQAQYQAASGAGPLYSRDTRNLKDPSTVQLSGGVQQQFSSNWAGEIAYAGSLGRHIPLIYDSNYVNEFYCNVDGICDNNTFFPIFTDSNVGSSHYHSMVVRIRGEAWRGLTLHAAYTFSKSLDDIAGSQYPLATDSLWNQLFGRQLYGLGNPVAFSLGANSILPPTTGGGLPTGRGGELLSKLCTGNANCLQSQILAGATIPSINSLSSALTTTGSRQILVSSYNLPQDPVNYTTDDRGRSDFDVRHRVVMDVVYAVPELMSRKWLNGFAVSGILIGQSGQPYTIFSGPAYGQITQRVNMRSATLPTTGKPNQYFADPGAFQLPSKAVSTGCNIFAYPQLYNGKTPTGSGACLGNSPRNGFTGPNYITQDFSVQKATRVFRESQSIILRAEFFNLFNRANYYNPITQFSTDGVHPNPEFGMIRSAHDPRQIQFAVRYDF